MRVNGILSFLSFCDVCSDDGCSDDGWFVCPIFLHSLRGVAELTRSLRSLVRSRLSQLVKKNRPHSPTMK